VKAPRSLDAALLALLAFRHYGYQFWPQGQWGVVYGMAGACCLLALLALSDIWPPLKIWAAAEEFLTAGCSAAWLQWPQWFVREFADEKCSQMAGFKLGSIGLSVVAWLAYRMVHPARSYRLQDRGKPRE
jgi:hypothetical protein